MAQASSSSTTTTPTPLKNLYHRRLVAPTSSKPCFICHKPSSTVLITPDDRDFFYACSGHLKDTKFATPQDGAGASGEDKKKAERKQELDKEIEKVKREWEEKRRKKKGKDKDKDKGKGKGEEEKDEKKEEEQHEATVKKLEEEKKGVEKVDKEAKDSADDGPRVFVLHRNIFQMRLNKEKAAQQAKRDRERAKNPIRFPQVPSGPVT